jgi:hypothetical protein
MTVNANSCQENFFHSKEYQIMHYGRAYDDCRVGLEEAIEIDPKTFFGYVDLKKKRVGYPSVMHFEGRLASGPDDTCNVFADFIQRTYADDVWGLSDHGPDFVQDGPAFGALQFIVGEIQGDIPPLILKNCASAFARPLSLLFNRSLSTCVFPDRWKLS